MFAALFLAAGAALLGITYGLVASLPVKVPKPTHAQAKIALVCKLGKAGLGPAQCSQAVAAVGAEEVAYRERDQTLANLLAYSLAALGAMTVVSGGLGWVLAGRVVRPVSSITAAARRASEQHLGERLALAGPKDELRELADTFDQMLERLDAAFATQRRFVADASHELRTPLTVMRTAIEVTMAKPARTPEQLEAMTAKVARSAAQAEALIEALLTLAASEQAPASPELVDLATAAEDAVDSAAARAGQLGLRIDTDLAAAPACGNRLLLERMVGNLVDNAVRHNVRGGWISIRTGTGSHEARFEIANSGPVIPEELVPALFEPFRRVEERTSLRDGTGLGLAIVRSIGTAHGACVEAHSLSAGGLGVLVTMPLADGAGGPGS
jgi:signal transduction histidine kinase